MAPTIKPDDNPFQKPATSPVGEPGRGQVLLAAVPVVVLVLIVYMWLVSMGTWIQSPARMSYYDALATAFRHGQLFLEIKPDPALLALSDPFDPGAREHVPFLSDASLYQGRYYLYFGPVPALLLLLPKIVFSGVIGDANLVFAFVCGIFLSLALLILRIWRRFFPSISPWMVAASILVVGLISPFGWVLGSRAEVHDAAIASGQFFFLAGMHTALDALNRGSIGKSKAILTGAFWAGAMGSRITQVVPIVCMLVLISVVTVRHYRRLGILRKSAQALLPFVVPLVLGAVALGWYNWTRFGSVLETGIAYQLALQHIQKYRQELFSVGYVFQNLYNYLLFPPQLRPNFPYIRSMPGIMTSVIPSLRLPELYYAERMTGMVFIAPFLLFAFVPAFAGRLGNARKLRQEADQQLFNWLRAALSASFLGGFAFFLVFFWASQRYLLDFIPSALLLAVIGSWQWIDSLTSKPLGRFLVILLALVVIAASIILSNLLVLGLNAADFRLLNPVLWRHLNSLFQR